MDKNFEKLESWYLNDRLEKQINWYDDKSLKYKNWYKTLKIAEIFFSSLVPFLVVLDQILPISHYLIALSGVLSTFLAAINSLNKFHDLWLEYRTTAETLKHEKYFYLTKAGPYKNLKKEEAFILLVERVESLISKENTKWIAKIGNLEREIKEITSKKEIIDNGGTK